MSKDPKTGDLVKFSLKARINNPNAPAAPAAGPIKPGARAAAPATPR
jgi:hypothetical protein